MEKPAWEKCQYYSEGRCPQHEDIDRAYLIPQLLDTSQMQAAKEICETCAKYLAEGRVKQSRRWKFKVHFSFA